MNRFVGYLVISAFGMGLQSLGASLPVIQGHVTDTEGASVKGAHVLLRTDFAGGWSKVSYDANATTDRTGIFTFNIGTGFYDLCVMADAFTPECRKVIIQDHSVEENFKLKVSPEVSKRIADKF